MSNLGNFVQCRFVTPLAIGATEMTLYAADAPYNLPPAEGGLLVLCDSPGNPSFIEVISYTSRTGLNLSGVVRGLEGTTARAWSGFAYCFQSMLAGDFQSLLDSKLNAAEYTAADVLIKIKTVDGAGSGLDADLLDGQSGAYYLSASNLNAGTVPDARLSGTYTGVNITGNAATATKLATARTINGISFDGSANITIPSETDRLPLSGGTMTGAITHSDVGAVQTVTDSWKKSGATIWNMGREANGDFKLWYYTDAGAFSNEFGFKRDGGLYAPGYVTSPTFNGALAGNAATATKLATARTINGVPFDGSANISIAAGETGRLPLAGGTLTGALGGTTCNFSGRATFADSMTNGWYRSTGAVGWYSETYGGGIYMQDATYVRTYNGKSFLCNNVMRVEGYSPQVQLWDSDHGILRYLYADGGSMGFLNSNGNWSLINDNSGNTTSMGNVTAYSDIRLKKDIELIPDALDKVCALRGVTYERIDSGERQTGVIAQEVQAVLPEAVMTMTDEQQTLSVAYGNLVGLLIEAIKELKAEVDELKQGAK